MFYITFGVQSSSGWANNPRISSDADGSPHRRLSFGFVLLVGIMYIMFSSVGILETVFKYQKRKFVLVNFTVIFKMCWLIFTQGTIDCINTLFLLSFVSSFLIQYLNLTFIRYLSVFSISSLSPSPPKISWLAQSDLCWPLLVAIMRLRTRHIQLNTRIMRRVMSRILLSVILERIPRFYGMKLIELKAGINHYEILVSAIPYCQNSTVL